jgi:hypothetical protein
MSVVPVSDLFTFFFVVRIQWWTVFIIFGEVHRGGREKIDYMVLVSGWCGGACRSRWESDVALLRRIDVGDIIPFRARWARLVKRHVVVEKPWELPCPTISCGPKVNGSSSIGCMERDVCCVWLLGLAR